MKKTIFYTSLLLFWAVSSAVWGQSSNDISSPEGMIILNMTIDTEMCPAACFKYNKSGNFATKANANYTTSLVCVGKVKGLGAITFFPKEGWTNELSAIPGYGYIFRYKKNGQKDYSYTRIYVSEYLRNTDVVKDNGVTIKGGTVGVIVKYSNFNPKEGKQPDFVLIGGSKWATCNVGEKGEFVSSPEQYGNIYTFDEAQNACPVGWRLPSKDELDKLIEAGSTWTTQNGVAGYQFGSASRSLFLPAAGYRNYSNGTLSGRGGYGYYWSSTVNNSTDAYYVGFSSSSQYTGSALKSDGFSVRCIAEE